MEKVTQQYSFHLVLLVKLSDERSMTTHHMKNHANKPCPSQNHSQTKALITRQMIVMAKWTLWKDISTHLSILNFLTDLSLQNSKTWIQNWAQKKVFFSYTISYFFFLKCSRFQMHSFSPIFSFILKHTMIFTKQCN